MTRETNQQREEVLKKAGEILKEIKMEKQKMMKTAAVTKIETAEEIIKAESAQPGKKTPAEKPTASPQNKKNKTKNKKFAEGFHWKNIAICSMILWVILVGVGAFSMHLIINGNYKQLQANVDQALADLQRNNETAITAMKERVDAMDEKLSTITASMENTGAAISTSSQSSREEMAKQIATLQKELKSLQDSLKILQEKGKN